MQGTGCDGNPGERWVLGAGRGGLVPRGCPALPPYTLQSLKPHRLHHPSLAKHQVTASSGQSCFSRCRRGNLGEAPGHLRQLTQTKPEHGPRLPRCRMFSKQVALWGREVESFISKTKVHSANQDYKEQGKRSQQQLCPLSAEFALGHKEQIDNYCSNSFP